MFNKELFVIEPSCLLNATEVLAVLVSSFLDH